MYPKGPERPCLCCGGSSRSPASVQWMDQSLSDFHFQGNETRVNFEKCRRMQGAASQCVLSSGPPWSCPYISAPPSVPLSRHFTPPFPPVFTPIPSHIFIYLFLTLSVRPSLSHSFLPSSTLPTLTSPNTLCFPPARSIGGCLKGRAAYFCMIGYTFITQQHRRLEHPPPTGSIVGCL